MQNINTTYEAVFHTCSNFFRKMGKKFELVNFKLFRIIDIIKLRLTMPNQKKKLNKNRKLSSKMCDFLSPNCAFDYFKSYYV